MKKYRIGVIGLKGLPAFGGAATVGESLINELKNEYTFTVYAVGSHTHHEGQQDGYNQIVFRKFFIKKLNILVYYLRSAIHCVFAGNYDLIHLHHVDGAIIIPFLRLRYKVIFTSHAQPQANEKWPAPVKFFFNMNERIALRFASTITAVSIPLEQIYRQKTTAKIHYIPNGINLRQKIDDEIEPNGEYILFAAGRIIPLKGLHVLLQALHQRDLKQKLIVIGDLEQIPSYKSEIVKLSDGLPVEFIPIIKKKSLLLNYVKHASLFVFPSYSENMSVMMLEVAYTKTPLVCSDIPANTAVFNDSEVTFFKTNDAGSLAAQIDFALNNPGVIRHKSDAAYEKLQVHHDWSLIAQKYSTLYLELITG